MRAPGTTKGKMVMVSCPGAGTQPTARGRGGARWGFRLSQYGDGLRQSGAWLKPRRRGLSKN